MIKDHLKIKKFFDKFSNSYDKKAFGQSLGLQYLNQIEQDFIIKNLTLKKEDKFLDVGIGTGRNSSLFRGQEINFYGIDISKDMTKGAEEKLKKEKFKIIIADLADRFPSQNSFFDSVICFRVLKYIKNWPETLKEISRVIKKDGIFILETSNVFSIQALSLFSANYKVFNPFKLEKELKKNDFKILKIGNGSRLPFLFYKKINSKKMLEVVNKIERFLNFILPKRFLSRSLMYLCKKC